MNQPDIATSAQQRVSDWEESGLSQNFSLSCALPSGHNSEPWAAELKWQEYELLCPNGARAEANQFEACNLAQIPSHAVMVRPDTNIFTVYGLLDKAQVSSGHSSSNYPILALLTFSFTTGPFLSTYKCAILSAICKNQTIPLGLTAF